MGTHSLRWQVLLGVVFFGLLVPFMPRSGYEGDLNCWYVWGRYIADHGLGNVYQEPTNNYNPLGHYLLWLFGKLVGGPDQLKANLHYFKVFALVFDVAGAVWAASLVPGRKRRLGLMLLLLLNMGYLYNTVLWGQVDAIYTFFAFAAVVLAVRRHLVGSVLCFELCLLTKTQGIIFLPPLLLLWLPLVGQQPRRLLPAILAAAGLFGLVLAPFIWGAERNYLPRIIDINLHATEVYPFLSLYAYNLWYLLAPGPDPTVVPDAGLAAGLSYRTWGLLLFFASSALALLPLLLTAVRAWLARRNQPAGAAAPPAPDLALALLSCGLIPLLFTFCNTQMHERYWHPALLFLAAYGFLRRDYWPYALASVAYFLQMEDVLQAFRLKNYNVLIFMPWFIAVLFAVLILGGLVQLYRRYAALLRPEANAAGGRTV